MIDSRAAKALALSFTFIAVHLALGLLNIFAQGLPLGDVTIVYANWVEQAYGSGIVVGVDMPWVYPLLAIVPMLLAVTFGVQHIGAVWLTMVMLTNFLALGFLTRGGRSRAGMIAGWWWTAFLLLLGPIAIGRIDAITVALAIIGVRLLHSYPQTAGIILACATWIKVWPAALLLAAVVVLRDRGKIAIAAVSTSATVVVFALLAGAGGNVFSFISQQTGRGIQIESPIAGFWLWQIVAGAPDTYIYYDAAILTFQITGEGVDVGAALMTPLLAVIVVGIALLAVRAVRRGATAALILPALSLALVSALIVVNKVGSPQFIAWLAVPVLLGIVAGGIREAPSFHFPAALTLGIAALTHAIYPYFYYLLLAANPGMIVLVSIRNLLLVVLLGWAIVKLVTLPPQIFEARFPTGRAPGVGMHGFGAHSASSAPKESA